MQIYFWLSFGSITFFDGFNSRRAVSTASRRATFRKIHIVVCNWRSRSFLLLSVALLTWSYSTVCLIFQPSCTTPDPPSFNQLLLAYSATGAWRACFALPHLIGQCWILEAVNPFQVLRFSNAILNSIFQYLINTITTVKNKCVYLLTSVHKYTQKYFWCKNKLFEK